MVWVRTIPPHAATGVLADVYRAIEGARGRVAEVCMAQSLHPAALRAHEALYKAIVLDESALSLVCRERIAVTVSWSNGCEYCVAHHAAALRALGEPPERVDALASGVLPATLPHVDQVLLQWARDAALEPASSGEEGIATLRAAGLDDASILDAVLAVAYFSFVNRVVMLLGVDLEREYVKAIA